MFVLLYKMLVYGIHSVSTPGHIWIHQYLVNSYRMWHYISAHPFKQFYTYIHTYISIHTQDQNRHEALVKQVLHTCSGSLRWSGSINLEVHGPTASEWWCGNWLPLYSRSSTSDYICVYMRGTLALPAAMTTCFAVRVPLVVWILTKGPGLMLSTLQWSSMVPPLATNTCYIINLMGQ